MRHRSALILVCALVVLAVGGCAHRGESSRGAGMRPASMTESSGLDRTSSESKRYHQYDP